MMGNLLWYVASVEPVRIQGSFGRCGSYLFIIIRPIHFSTASNFRKLTFVESLN